MTPYLHFIKLYPHMKRHMQATFMHTIRNKMAVLGYVYTRETNIAFPPALCELDCNRRSDLRGSGTSASPRTWLVSIGAMCQALVARNIRWEEKYEKNNGVTTVYDTFPLRALQVVFGSLSCSPPWNKDIRVLQLSLSVTVSLIRLKRANTLR